MEQKGDKTFRSEQLTKNDPVWQRIKTYPCGLASKCLEDDVRVFIKEQDQYTKLAKKQNLTEAEMLAVTRKTPGIALQQQLFGTHRKLLELI